MEGVLGSTLQFSVKASLISGAWKILPLHYRRAANYRDNVKLDGGSFICSEIHNDITGELSFPGSHYRVYSRVFEDFVLSSVMGSGWNPLISLSNIFLLT